VFQHVITVVFVANQARASDVGVGVARHVYTDHLSAKVLCAKDQISRDDLIFDDALLVIAIVDEFVEGAHTLD
jgi:hypothetical protein